MDEMIEIIEANGRNRGLGMLLLMSNFLTTLAVVLLLINTLFSIAAIVLSTIPLLKSLRSVHRNSSKEKGAKAMTLINIGILLIEITLFVGFA